MKKTSNTTKPFYATAKKLLEMKVSTIDEVKDFYVGVNNLASEISLNSAFIKELISLKYNDNLKLIRGVNHILGYGAAVGHSGLFAKQSLTAFSPAKEVSLVLFFQLKPRAKDEIEIAQKEAKAYFDTFKKYTKEDRERDEGTRKMVEETRRMVEELCKQLKPKSTSPKSKHTTDLVFPEVVQWCKVLLKVKEGGMDLEIWYDGKHIKTADYIELGFSATKKNHKSDRRWELLLALSALQMKDIKQATPNILIGMLKSYGGRPIKRENLHKIKQLLSRALKSIFETDEDPFTNSKKYYEPRFTILPVPILRNEKPWEMGGYLNENANYGDLENGEE